MSVTAYPTLRLKLTVPQALKIRFLPAIPGTNAGNAAAAAEAAAQQAIAAAQAATAATASKVDKAGDSMSGLLTLSADPVANLHAATKQYVDASIGGTGSVSTAGPVITTQLAGYADTTGNVIRGVDVGVGLDLSAGTTLNLDGDLAAIATLSGVNTIYYRSSDAVWSPVIIGTNLSFAGGTLSAAEAGDVASVPTPANGQLARWTDATHIEGISAATALTAIGAQPLDADLTALAALSGTNTIYYRSAANTWSPVLIGANMTFTGGTLSSSGAGGGGGVAAVGTPTTGQLARWTTGTTIEGIDTSTLGLAPLASPTFTGDARSVTPATGDNDTSIATTAYVQANLAFFAPLASPVLTGDPQAPTPATGDNDTSVATTAFVKAQAYAPLASPTFTGTPAAPTASPGDNDTSIATTAFVTAAIAAIPATVVVPQGRLTLQTDTPTMATTQAAKTTIFYTPYVGNRVPIYDGTSMLMTAFTELSVATTDTTKSPAAIGVSKVNDWFVWNDAGTLRLGHGPDWTNDTTPAGSGARPGLVRIGSCWLNELSITNGPAAQRGTYVGTTKSDPAATLTHQFGSRAAGGGPIWLGVWNAYNRIPIHSAVQDGNNSWSIGAVQPNMSALNLSLNNRISIVCGLAEDSFEISFRILVINSSSDYAYATVGFNSVTVPAIVGVILGTVPAGMVTSLSQTFILGGYSAYPFLMHGRMPLGFHFFQAQQAMGSGTGAGSAFGNYMSFVLTWRH